MSNAEQYKDHLDNVQNKLNIHFEDQELLFRSLVHDSFVYENDETVRSNERLEFLGDSILGMVISHLLYENYRNWDEGEMALFKSHLVSAESLAKCARKINLGNYLFLGKGEDASGGRKRESILSDALEALLGAIYLDIGFEKVREFIIEIFGDNLDVETPIKDYKSHLQELSQKRFKSLPRYNIIEESGPPHKKIFKVRVMMENNCKGEGEGTSKKDAEQKAARNLLDNIDKIPEAPKSRRTTKLL
ncbi:MAG: ribonuclease III [Candidatus Eremiobacteraeota bacterium]|nr:ribonuclease III [Candidatus Eremiobacteraeota bacterium]